jgi:hypothetical protein
MAYITQTDVENQFGASNIALWSNLDNVSMADGAPVADTARIAAAIAFAERYVEDRFRDGKYTVPFVELGTDALLVLERAMAKIAGVELYKHRPPNSPESDRVLQHMTEANELIDFYLRGQRILNCQRSASRRCTSPGVVL